ncbi:MarR family winged helix-turn-helix transcriptional regulator [Collinsella tanakaei]|uniref:MarR family winged helix-turn-helix transcriptional regulator n=1 Tax=Collinsella tanakaei TaxID=626935 RepID=UPI001EF48AB2|nr:MarR family transcriptional regulator [Collinsella tanakaei]
MECRTNDSIHHLLLMAFSHSNRAMLGRTRAVGLMPGQPKVLEHLMVNDGCSQRDIAQACVMDKSTVASVLARMEEGGLIERVPDEADRRRVHVQLTRLGREAGRCVQVFGDQVDDTCLTGFSASEAEQLKGLLGRVISNLAASEEMGE